MNKSRKTYGIKGFMEYQAVIKVGKSRMKVPFTDGAMTAMGVVPCTFSTERFMVQHAIENSDEFRRGLIYIVRSIPLDGKVEIEHSSPTLPSSEPQAALPGTEEGNLGAEARGDAKKLNPESKTSQKIALSPEPQAALQETEAERSQETEAPLTQVEFASNDEAKDYLEQNFGLVRSKLRNREEIFNAGKANGVEIHFI